MSAGSRPDFHAERVGLDDAALATPEGWEPIAELCRRVAARSAEVIETIVARIRAELPDYRADTVSLTELRASVADNLAMVLVGTAQRRGPLPEELQIRSELGVLRADQGLPVNALLEAFVVGYREIWNELVRESHNDPPAVRELLLTAAGTVWEWVHEVTDAVGTAYHGRVLRGVAVTSALRERLFDALLTFRHDHDEARELARGLGFDENGAFRALAIAADALDGTVADALIARFPQGAGTRHAVKRGDQLLVLDQGSSLPSLVQTLRDGLGELPIGTGLCRRCLGGAALSIQDARGALAVSRRSGTAAEYARDWHDATLLAAEPQLRELLAPVAGPARRQPELARTVRAYADCGFSMSAAARLLSVHTNTVAYRLARWTELTGSNPRTYHGLVRSMAALTVVGAEER